MKRTSFLVNELIKQRRRAALMSQRDLAEYCQLGKGGMQALSNIERELCPVPAKLLVKLVKVLNLDKAEIIELHARDARREMAAVLGLEYE